MAGSSRNDEEGLISDINVTPLVDITLVLLIIFMVTAKIIVSQSLPMDLPKASGPGQEVQLIFGVDLRANGETMIDGKKIAADDAILPAAREAQAKTPDLRAVIRAEASVPHGRVIRALDLMRQGGISKIAFGYTPVPAEGGTPAATSIPAPPVNP